MNKLIANKLIALVLSVSMLISLVPSFSITLTAETTEEEILTLNVPGELTPANIVYTTAIIKNDAVTLYNDYSQGASGKSVYGVAGETITLWASYSYLGEVYLYSYYYDSTNNENLLNAYTSDNPAEQYRYILASDVTLSTDSGSTDDGDETTTCNCNTAIDTHATTCPLYKAPEEGGSTEDGGNTDNGNEGTTTPEVCSTCGTYPCTCPTIVLPEPSVTLDYPISGIIAENITPSVTTATINSSTVKLYKSLDYGAEGIEIPVDAGTQISLVTKYTFTVNDTLSYVFYRYEYNGTNTDLHNAALSEISGYPFIYAGDLAFENAVLSNAATGVSVSANLPADVLLTVTSKTLADVSLDTNIYPVSNNALFYDVTLYQNGSEYQPSNGITVTFPESAILNSGLAVGDSYHVYHIHNGAVEMRPATVYYGGDLSLTFNGLSEVGIVETTDPIDLSANANNYTKEDLRDSNNIGITATLKDEVVLYDNIDAANVYTATVTGAGNTEIELIYKITLNDENKSVYYQLAYYGTSGTALANVLLNYSIIPAEYVNIPGEETNQILTNTETGVSVSGYLPSDVTLSVSSKTLAETGLNTSVYPVSSNALFYDVTLYQNGSEYQPSNGITVTFPESAILNSGLAVGDNYKVYHLHGDSTDVTGPFTYNGGDLSLNFDSLSVVGISESGMGIKVTDVYGDFVSSDDTFATTYAVIKTDTIRVYGAASSETTDYYELNGVQGEKIELYYPKVTYANGVLYHMSYLGDDETIKTVNNYFIPEEFITITCCATCTATAGCTCCENCTFTNISITNGDVTVSGVPKGTSVNCEDVSYDEYIAVKKGLATISLFRDWENTYLFGYDISLVDESGVNYQPINDQKKVTVNIANVWDTSWDFPIVEVYHILENETALNSATSDGTVRWCTNSDVVAAYNSIAQYVNGVLSVPYVLLSSTNGLVSLNSDGSISFESDSFSDHYILSSDAEPIVISASSTSSTGSTYNIYMLAGTTAALDVASIDIGVINGHNDYQENSAGVTLSQGVVGTAGTTYTISVAADAATSTSAAASYSIQFNQTISGTEKTINATINVYVYSQNNIDSYLQTAYSSNTVSHIQINIDTILVMINGKLIDTLTDLNLHYSSSNAGTPQKMDDPDSQVGYYYIYSYTTDGIETNISIRIDETSLPRFMFDANGNIREEYLTSLQKWSFSSVSIDTSQNQISFEGGTVPVGTMQYPVNYIITVETTYTGSNTTYYNQEMTLTDTIGFWDLDNVCPGVGNSPDMTGSSEVNKFLAWQNGAVSTTNPGIDIAKFSTGYTDAEGNTYYVIYNDLTKIVHGFDFASSSTVSSRTYAFTIYRRPSGSTDESAWVAVDTISATVSANDIQDDGTYKLTTSLNTSAEKYYGYLTGYEYKIEETGYSIAGYDCDTVFTIGENTSSGNSTLFTWEVNEILTYNSPESDSTTDSEGYTTTTSFTYTKDANGTVTFETVTTSVKTDTETVNSGGTPSSEPKTEIVSNTDGSITVTTTEITYERLGWNEYYKVITITAVTTKTVAEFPSEYLNAATKTYVYYAEIQCDNTYSQLKSGMTIEKVLQDTDGRVSTSDDYFQVIITPTNLESENGLKDFNGKIFYYTINGSGSYSVTATSPSSGFGSITLYIKAGDEINFEGLPIGTYSVVETGDCYYTDSGTGYVADIETTTDGVTTKAKYLYDTTIYTKTLKTGAGAKVTLTNTSTAPLTTTLTIVKAGDYSSFSTIDPNQTFMFKVEGETDDVDLTVTIHGNGSTTIDGLTVGYTYTVTELTDWSWRYRYDSYSTSLINTVATNGANVTLNASGNTITFTNNRDEQYWLDGDSWCDNRFAGKSN